MEAETEDIYFLPFLSRNALKRLNKDIEILFVGAEGKDGDGEGTGGRV